MQCPYKEILEPKQQSDSTGSSENPLMGSSKYVPPSLRDSSSMRSREDSWTVRVTNLSQLTTEQDLRLFFDNKKIGASPIRLYMARDENGYCIGYAFVSYSQKEHAERAINLVNGHGFGNLIIKCEWALEKKPN